jgi:hypothetical protein
MADRELCYECMRPVTQSADGGVSCKPCDRHGYYTRGMCGDQQVVVRFWTQWPQATAAQARQVRHG